MLSSTHLFFFNPFSLNYLLVFFLPSCLFPPPFPTTILDPAHPPHAYAYTHISPAHHISSMPKLKIKPF